MQSNISAQCYDDIPSDSYKRHLLDLEKTFDYWQYYYWFLDNWKICFYIIAFYLVAIVCGRHIMKSRKPFDLRKQLFVWNLALAMYSIFAASRVISELIYTVQEYGFYSSLCHNIVQQRKQAIGIWAFLFAYSKVAELGDTAFIILRKTPLIFLHWYHHATALYFVWGSSAYPSLMQVYFMGANLFVHSLMYSYYALKSLRVPIPRKFGMVITILQLTQMVFAVFVTGYSYYIKLYNENCCVFDQAVIIAVAIFGSYFLLFMNFFNHAYVKKDTSTGLKEKGSDKKVS